MHKIVIIIHRYFISFIYRMNRWDILFSSLLSKLIPLSSHVWSIIFEEFWCDEKFFTYIFCPLFCHWCQPLTLYLLIFQSNEWIKWSVILNIDMSNIWSFYNIITVWCIKIIWFIAIDVWFNSITSPLLRNVQNLPELFPSWRRKHHIYLFYFCK